MTWVHPLSAQLNQPAEVLGGKAHGLVVLQRLGLPVPPGFVVSTEACRAYLRDGRLPYGLEAEVSAALETQVRRVSVRSGASVSMPGMMDTVLDVGADGVLPGIESVFQSWNTPRAQTYRELHGIPHDLGTAVTVQAMVYGDWDDQSGSGVAFSRDPNTGEPHLYGDVLFGHKGSDVVSGRDFTQPVTDLALRLPYVWEQLVVALRLIEGHYRDACYVEFTVEAGTLWLLQVRPGGLGGAAAIRVAVDLVDHGVIDRREALQRISAQHLQHARTTRIAAGSRVLATGRGACSGVAVGRIATTADGAVRMAASGPVILVRPETSPLDLHGLAAAVGVVTARGGLASHAAVVARAMGKPAVVGVTDLAVDDASARFGRRTAAAGELITIDGTSGDIVAGRPAIVAGDTDPYVEQLLNWADDVSGGAADRPAIDRLRAAHAAHHAAGLTKVDRGPVRSLGRPYGSTIH